MSDVTNIRENNVNFEMKPDNSEKKTDGNDGSDGMMEISVDKDKSSSDANVLSGNVIINRNMDISERVQNFKSWGINTFMRTKQKVKEKLSKTSRTIDIKLEDMIDKLKMQRNHYNMKVAQNNRVIEQLVQMSLVHQSNNRLNAEFSQSERLLSNEFLDQSQKDASRVNFIKELINKLICSNETFETLVNKTYVDLLNTVDVYDTARIEFDAYKTETVRLVSQMQQKKDLSTNDQIRLQEMQVNLEQRRIKYEKLKVDVEEKIDLFEDHKNRVVQREIINCQHAWFNYYSQCTDLYSESRSRLSISANKSDKIHEQSPTEN